MLNAAKSLIWCLIFSFFPLALANAQAQYQVLYNFGASGASDGQLPEGKLVFDKQGNLYGTTELGGVNAAGAVFELTPSGGGQWTETLLYSFCSQPDCSDGARPMAGLIWDREGNLYGTTNTGGTVWGTVFELSPPTQQGGAWTETVLYTFSGNPTGDGCYPESKLTFDALGDLYGTTSQCGGGNYSAGSVFELTPSGDGTWSEIVLHKFCKKGLKSCPDGGAPRAGVEFDKAGNLYGTTFQGGRSKGGVVYELSPAPGGGWKETVLHAFGQTANRPMSAINMDESGNLYGTASLGGFSNGQQCNNTCGGVFRLTKVGGQWKASLFQFNGQNGGNPAAGILLIGKKNVAFGTTLFGGTGGTVFEFRGSTESVIHNFCSEPNCTDGSLPATALIADGSGILYGTTTEGGAFGQGVVFQITP